ncbi:MAG: hypothetical protein KKG43_04155 [Candidatus Omnitrophica bacterium]|nr:hypothetical protein [Candidatus Omnitrophota bacterium]MBU1928699.1 hypothetical protein [Candidatus Omnitrophota bacterium]MBU2035367.1 hypothetical protein [Candidatus Omnitrophota bacterium]MBU2258245.1 hypothetical protein [Candidatus Omnitrophota bacterium]
MPDKLEKLIRLVYRRSKRARPAAAESHPDEEDIACFLEERLSQEEKEHVLGHLFNCDVCMENLAIQLRLHPVKEGRVPLELLKQAKDMVSQKSDNPALEVILKLKDQVIEILSSTGDLFWGAEKVPLPILRGSPMKEFKDEVTILKNFNGMVVEVKIENKQGKVFKLNIKVMEKTNRKKIKDLRITLIKGGVELESYYTDSGRVIFEHVLLGKYKVEIYAPDTRLASMILDIKV